MAVWSQILTSDLVGAIRLDAEFWHPYYLEKEKIVRLSKHVPLGSVVSTFKKGIFYILAREYAENGVPFYRSSNMGPILPKEENITFITERKHKHEHKTALVNGDLMIVKTGKSGASVVLKDRCNVSQDVIAVKVSSDQINPYYLAVYLNTKFGFSEMNRWFQGQVQPHLSLEDARRIWVPLISGEEQKKIETLVLFAARAETIAKQSWSTAQHLLESELGLDKLNFQKPVGYRAQFSDTLISGRFDADYYQPQFADICQIVKNYHNGYEPLIHFATPLKPNIDPSKTPDQVYHYIELSNINSSLGTVDGFESKFGKDLPSRARRQVQYGDVIASSVVGSIDKASVIDKAQDSFVASTGFFHLRPITISPEYLLMLVRSKCVCMQFQQQATGGILSAVPDSRLKNVIVPKVPDRLQQEITQLVIQSHESKRKSKELLDQAKARVEQLIEEAVR